LELLLIPALEPILNPLWVFIFDGQSPSLLSAFGGVVIVSTILIWSLKKGRAKNKEKET
jgi:drug/metabolite transporter (DMT)-like permease